MLVRCHLYIELGPSILKTTNHNWKFDTSLETHISERLFDTAYNESNSHLVDTLKLNFSKYGKFQTSMAQWNASEWLMLSMDIINKALFYRSIYDDFIQGFFIRVLVLVRLGIHISPVMYVDHDPIHLGLLLLKAVRVILFICINLYHMGSFVTSFWFHMSAWFHYWEDTYIYIYMLKRL